MKKKFLLALSTVAACALLGPLAPMARAQRGAEKLLAKTVRPAITAEQALTQALAGPDGEYAAHAEYAAILQKFGDVQPYAAIIHAEERHVAVLKAHFERRGLAVPADPFAGKIQAPATLKEAAQAGVKAEELNVAMYEKLLAQVQGQPDLVRVFTHLQWASREHHLPAFKAAAAKNGELAPGESPCGAGGGQRRGGPPPWAGGRGRGFQQGGCCGACTMGGATPAPGAPRGR